MRNLAFGVRFDSFEFGGSLFHPLSPSLLGLLPILLFRLFGVERHYTISLLIYSFIFFSFAGSLKTAEGGGENLSQVSEVCPGQFRAQQFPFLLVLFPPVSSPVSSSFDIPLPVVPVNYTLSNFAFIRGLLIHKLPRTVTGAKGRGEEEPGATNRLSFTSPRRLRDIARM